MVASLGDPVEILAQHGDWYRIHVIMAEEPDVAIVGWIESRWITLLSPISPDLVTPTSTP